MYNCHLDTQPGDLGPFKGCYSVTSTERSFSPRSKKRLETSKHPLNGGSGIFLFELIGINRGMIEKVGQNLSPKIKQVGYRRSKCRWITYFNILKTSRRAWRHTFTKSDRRKKGLSTDVNECWPTFRPSAPQSYQCLISHLPASMVACNLKLYTHVLIYWQLLNSVSADQYRLTVSRAQVSTHWVRVFFEVIRWQVATFQMIAGSSSIF